MLKQGVVNIKEGVFPKLEDKWTDHEKEHMLILLGIDVGKGLALIQTVPELMEQNKCLAYSERDKAAINLYYPIIDSSMNKEFIQAKVIALLNAATADEKNPAYAITFVFICDDEYKKFKLGAIFQGDPSQGTWAPESVVTGLAATLSMEAYKQADNGEKQG